MDRNIRNLQRAALSGDSLAAELLARAESRTTACDSCAATVTAADIEYRDDYTDGEDTLCHACNVANFAHAALAEDERDEDAMAYLFPGVACSTGDAETVGGDGDADLADVYLPVYVLNGERGILASEDMLNDAAMCAASQSLWAFRPSFLAGYMGPNMEPALSALSELYETAQPAIIALLGDNVQDCVTDAVSADGWAHFLDHLGAIDAEPAHRVAQKYMGADDTPQDMPRDWYWLPQR